jgi:hypothetical protein
MDLTEFSSLMRESAQLRYRALRKRQADSCAPQKVRERTWANFSNAAETRLLPDGKIVGIQTRWHLDDPIGRLLRRAEQDKRARQFLYVSLARGTIAKIHLCSIPARASVSSFHAIAR